ncbi:MAG: hypothetical protein KGJ62_14655 [Armatimonadetes bacterium]|nr:hypothetical protein [Armatimonadota bacterium]MDE2207735.1 hypothetical protein [Armatimonadota bacterium]
MATQHILRTGGWREEAAINHRTYNAALAAGSPLLAAWLAQRWITGKSRPGWRERWGKLPESVVAANGCVWLHAVSVGETVAAIPIAQSLRQQAPHRPIVASVSTPTGMAIAQSRLSALVDGIFYMPFDLPWVAERVLDGLRPRAFAAVESELWPNLLHALRRRAIPTLVVNARMSDRTLRFALGAGRGVYRWMLANVDRVLAQSDEDARRFRQVAGPVWSEGVCRTLGNSKYDTASPVLNAAETAALRANLRLPAAAPVFIAGSTRSGQEDGVVLDAYRRMAQAVPGLCLIIAPRHLERVPALEREMLAARLTPVRRTAIPPEGDVRCIILDTLGELASLYSVADVAFVGNSFPPVVKGGGQSLTQPVLYGLPTLFGPHIATVRSVAGQLQEAGIGFQVHSVDSLSDVAIGLFSSPEQRASIHLAAANLVAANQGASQRFASEILQLASRGAAGCEGVGQHGRSA